ncbi:DUF2177 family protein [Candidatus Pacearchaeota archaeon]|nr:DUF2177 family protein [Candidatus Pacearchaeota archaeon]
MDTEKIKRYFAALLIVLAIDLTWVLVIAKPFYINELSGFARPEIVPIWSALLAWSLIPLGIVLFVDRVSKSNKQSLIYGALFGFILYGVYDFTNYATLANFTLTMVVVDIAWGTFLCSISSFLLRFFLKSPDYKVSK